MLFILSFCVIACGGKGGESLSSGEKESALKESYSISQSESLEDAVSTSESLSIMEESQSISSSLSESLLESQSESEDLSESLLESESQSEEESTSNGEKESESTSKVESESSARYYTVTFDTDGGSEVASVTVKEGDLIARPQNPEKSSRDGEYQFVCWTYEGRPWDFEGNTVTQDITLVAKWEKVDGYTPPYLPEE